MILQTSFWPERFLCLQRSVSAHSYLVNDEKGRQYHLHVNNVKLYQHCVAVIGVIPGKDQEYGDIQYVPTDHSQLCNLVQKIVVI